MSGSFANGGPAGRRYHKGRLLVAGPNLRDGNFFRTVVLMLEHSEEGAMGLVVNRPSSVTVENALSGQLDCDTGEEVLYVGGPVEPGDLFLLHAEEDFAGDSHETCEGVFVTTSPQVFEGVLCCEEEVRFRAISGYAGWSPGQLESELEGGDWLLSDADADEVFGCDPYELWDRVKARVAKSHHLVEDAGGHPEWN